MTYFEPVTYLRPTPSRAEADTVPESPGASRIGGSGRRLFSLIGWMGLATYAFGMPAAIWTWLG